MSTEKQPKQERVTENDLILAEAYFKILVDVARAQDTISYGDLVSKAKALFPNSGDVQRAIATTAGRKLNVVRMFTNEQGLPDLSGLVINQNTKECGKGFLRNFDPEEVRYKVFSFDWSSVDNVFTNFVKICNESVKPRKPAKGKTLNESDAIHMMVNHYNVYKDKYPKNIRIFRDQIIKMIMGGMEVDQAFNSVINHAAN